MPGAACRAPRRCDYLAFARLLWASGDKTICEAVKCAGPLYDRLARPLFVAALNTEPQEGSAALAGAIIRETLVAGGQACRPLIARDGLGPAFIEPALRYLQARSAPVQFGHRLRALEFVDDRVSALDFGEDKIAVGEGDAVILAVPPVVAAALLPKLTAPTEFRAIVNVHFRIDPPPDLAADHRRGQRHDRMAVRIPRPPLGHHQRRRPAARRAREDLAQTIWREVAAVAGLPNALPPWQIVRERRATFAATPEENAKRPGAATAWRNLVLAGDWTQTGLPATIEGAIRSGNRAADLVG